MVKCRFFDKNSNYYYIFYFNDSVLKEIPNIKDIKNWCNLIYDKIRWSDFAHRLNGPAFFCFGADPREDRFVSYYINGFYYETKDEYKAAAHNILFNNKLDSLLK